MARLLVSLLFAVFGGISFASGTRWIGCTPGVGQEIISLNQILLPRANIVASSQRSSDPDDDLVDYGINTPVAWCTDISSSNDLFPTIDITFTEPVLLTGFLSGGYDYGGGNVEYVNNFTLEYSSSLEDPGGPLEFFVPAINSYFPVHSLPLVVETIHLSVYRYVLYIGDICWNLALFGCPISEAIQVPTTSTMSVMSTDITQRQPVTTQPVFDLTTSPGSGPPSLPSVVEPSSTPSGSDTEPISSKETVVEKDFMVLAIVLPIALVTILIVFVIVAVGVFICVKNKEEWSPRERERSDTLKILDNSELYLASRERTDTIRHTANTLYQSSADQTYEMIGKGIDDGDGMEMNPTYNDPLIYRQNGETGDHTTEYAYPNVNISAEGAGPGRNDAGVQTKPNESYNIAVVNDTEVTEYAYPTVNVSVVGAGTGNSSANVYEETPH